MGRVQRIPVRVRRPEEEQKEAGAPPANPQTIEEATQPRNEPAAGEETQFVEAFEPEENSDDNGIDWRDKALRLQAEMDNYRKRQRRLAQDQVEAQRDRLLGLFLLVVDDLERALEAPAGDPQALREGVELTRRAALQRLRNEGVTRIEALGQPFDPHRHDAVSTVPHDGTGAGPDTVVQVLEPGYRLGERLLRPARIVVAV